VISRAATTLKTALIVAAIPVVAVASAQTGRPDVESGIVDFTVDIDPTDLEAGKLFTVSFTLTYPTGTQTYFPEVPDVHPFVLTGHDRETAHIAGTASGETHGLTLLPVRVGTSVLDPIEVPYIDTDGQAGMAYTPEIRIDVRSTIGDEIDPDLAPAGESVPVRVPNSALIWTLFGLLTATAAATAGIMGYRVYARYREAHRPPPPPRPPLDVALERLAMIEDKGQVESGEYKQLALDVSEAIREFLGGCLGFSGVDMTTFEVMCALEGRDLGRTTMPELEDFLGLCDLVKFAKFEPTPSEAAGIVPRARDIVERVAEAYPANPAAAGEAIET